MLSAGQSLQEMAVHHVDATYYPKQVPQKNVYGAWKSQLKTVTIVPSIM